MVTDPAEEMVSLPEAAALLGDGVTHAHVRARLRRGSLDGVRSDDGALLVSLNSIEQSLLAAPTCGGCGARVTEMIIVKYPHHDRVEFELCAEHAVKTAIAYGRQGQVLEVVTYPYQSEAWLKPRP